MKAINKTIIGATLGIMSLGFMGSAVAEEDYTIFRYIKTTDTMKLKYYIYPDFKCDVEKYQPMLESNPDQAFGIAEIERINLDTGETNSVRSCYTQDKVLGKEAIVIYPGDADMSSKKAFMKDLNFHQPSKYKQVQ